MKNNKAPGIDGINNKVLKKLPEVVFVILSEIFNCCLSNGYFPNNFKQAIVIPILKTGKDPKLPGSYRPISLLSSLNKVFEKLIYDRLLTFTNENDIYNKKQFGFRKEHSTVHQIKRVYNIINNNKQKRRSTGAIILDIEKAFDSVWHDGLVYKLHLYDYPLYLQKIIKSFLTNRSFFVKVESDHSTERYMPAGLPQGSILSPILYSIFTSDVPAKSNYEYAFYADDTAIICSGKSSNVIVRKMEESLNHINKFFNKWKIKLNREKTNAIIFPFNKSPKRVPTRTLTVEGNPIHIKDEIKYLGVTLDKKLTFRQHIDSVRAKAIRCGRALYPMLNKRSRLNLNNKILLYTMCIRPILTYGCQAWFEKAAKTHTKKLQIIQNKNLKIIHNLPLRYSTDQLHTKYGHRLLTTTLRDLTLSFNDRCRNSNYVIIRNLV